MPINVLCPNCHKELAAPDELAGGVALCPYCQRELQVVAPVAGPTNPGSQTVRMPVPAARGTAGPDQKESQQRGRGVGVRETVSMRSLGSVPPTAMPPAPPLPTNPSPPHPGPTNHAIPPVVGPPVGSSPIARTGPAPVFKTPPAMSPGAAPPAVGTAPPIAQPPLTGAAPPIAAKPASPKSAPKETARRRMNRAVFKTSDTAKSQVHLGADGLLPELVLEEAGVKEIPVEERKGTNPMVLLGVLGISVGLSVLMLLVDSRTAESENRSKAAARETISARYVNGNPLEPYQVLLREAQQAHARGNQDLERARYRRVLDMLHAEDKNVFEGLTGVAVPGPSTANAPNDRELEQLLSILLAED